jgi:hypothetical protein
VKNNVAGVNIVTMALAPLTTSTAWTFMGDIVRHDRPSRTSYSQSGHIMNEHGSIGIAGESSVCIGTVADREMLVIGPMRIVNNVPLAITQLADITDSVQLVLDPESQACIVQKGGLGLSSATDSCTYRFGIENGILVLRKWSSTEGANIVATFGTRN